MFDYTYQSAAAAPYGGVPGNNKLLAMMQSAHQGGGTGISNAIAPLGIPQAATNRIQQEMRNYGRVSSAQAGLDYELNRGAADSAQQMAAAQARGNAALQALGFNQNAMRFNVQQNLDRQSQLMQMLSPFFASMYQEAGL